ncbi:hypothetical protein Tco_0233788 [Tanacetum coccineum]
MLLDNGITRMVNQESLTSLWRGSSLTAKGSGPGDGLDWYEDYWSASIFLRQQIQYQTTIGVASAKLDV